LRKVQLAILGSTAKDATNQAKGQTEVSDDLKQRIAAMKEAAEKAQRTPMWRMDSRVSLEFERHVKPDSVLALIAELERLERENAELKQVKAQSAIPPQTCYDPPWWG
jgi:hypothetical protein